MVVELDLKPEVAARIEALAKARGVSMEAFIASLIEGMNTDLIGEIEDKDPRIAAMHAAASDELFLNDLAATMEDFKHVDAEYNH